MRLLNVEGSGIRVASYLTESLPKAELERKLHEAVALARHRLSQDDRRRHLLDEGKE